MKSIISLANHKGGVGKTCSTANIGAYLSNKGCKTLLIDLDPQAHLTTSFGIQEASSTIYRALRGDVKIEPTQVDKNLFIVPSDIDLSAAEMELSAEAGREYILKELLVDINNFEYILIDCPPSLGLLTLNALTAAQWLLIPLQAEFLAMKGLTKLIEIVEKIRRRLNTSLELLGVFLTQYDNRRTLSKKVLETAEAMFPNKVFKTVIRNNVSIAEAPAAGLDIFRYAPKSNGAIDYKQLTMNIHSIIK